MRRRHLTSVAPETPLRLPAPAVVIWHDIECGSYQADLPLWRALAREAGGPILDVGAGSGRVALRLAGAGCAVTALDREPLLLAALAERARAEGLAIETVEADATALELGARRFALIAVPMQTVQLFAPQERRAFLAAAARHLRPGGRVALAIADALEGHDEDVELPLPDLGDRDGWRFVSQPVAVRTVRGGVQIERVRQAISPELVRHTEPDVIFLADLTVGQLEQEGRAAGLAVEPARRIPATADHVASEVVVLHA